MEQNIMFSVSTVATGCLLMWRRQMIAGYTCGIHKVKKYVAALESLNFYDN